MQESEQLPPREQKNPWRVKLKEEFPTVYAMTQKRLPPINWKQVYRQAQAYQRKMQASYSAAAIEHILTQNFTRTICAQYLGSDEPHLLSFLERIGQKFKKISQNLLLWKTYVENHFSDEYGIFKDTDKKSDTKIDWRQKYGALFKRDYVGLSNAQIQLFILARRGDVEAFKQYFEEEGSDCISCRILIFLNRAISSDSPKAAQFQLILDYLYLSEPLVEEGSAAQNSFILAIWCRQFTQREDFISGFRIQKIPQKSIFEAVVKVGNPEYLKWLLPYCFQVEGLVRAALLLAIEGKHIECVQLLLQKEVRHPGALKGAVIADSPSCVALILKTDPQQLNDPDRFGITPLFWAVKENYPGCAELLLDAGARADIFCSYYEETIFQAALRKDHVECVQRLLRAGMPIEGAPPHKCKTLFRQYVRLGQIVHTAISKKNFDPLAHCSALDVGGTLCRLINASQINYQQLVAVLEAYFLRLTLAQACYAHDRIAVFLAWAIRQTESVEDLKIVKILATKADNDTLREIVEKIADTSLAFLLIQILVAKNPALIRTFSTPWGDNLVQWARLCGREEIAQYLERNNSCDLASGTFYFRTFRRASALCLVVPAGDDCVAQTGQLHQGKVLFNWRRPNGELTDVVVQALCSTAQSSDSNHKLQGASPWVQPQFIESEKPEEKKYDYRPLGPPVIINLEDFKEGSQPITRKRRKALTWKPRADTLERSSVEVEIPPMTALPPG